MSGRGSLWLAWGLAVLALLLLVAADVLSLATRTGFGVGAEIGFDVFMWAITLAFAAVGGLIASRHPDNAIGWLFLVAAVAAGLGSLAGSYAEYWIKSGAGPELLGKTAAWYAELSWIPWILVPTTFLLLLFPDGRLLSRRWRPVAWCAALGMAGGFVTEGLHPGRISDYPQLMNPYGVQSSLLEPLTGLALLLLLGGIVGSSASLIFRFRRERGEQRQQIKWLAFAGAVAAITVTIGSAAYDVLGENVANITIMLSVLGLPLAAGIAIMRYRLYDIDVVINRTLVYGALTISLISVYFGGVVTLQYVLRALTGGESQLAVVASTLAIAALFSPLRRRVQGFVNRRFYRSKYDARKTLEAFSARLREETDLEALNDDLVGVVRQTIQPAHVSLWLRPETAPQREQTG
jgi:hypothetical protein